MSADNWAICPRCARNRRQLLDLARTDLDAAYGKVPVEEFDALRAAYEARVAERPEPTFREDYEFYGVEDGVLHIRYGGGCETCGLRHEFSADQPLNVEETSRA